MQSAGAVEMCSYTIGIYIYLCVDIIIYTAPELGSYDWGVLIVGEAANHKGLI